MCTRQSRVTYTYVRAPSRLGQDLNLNHFPDLNRFEHENGPKSRVKAFICHNNWRAAPAPRAPFAGRALARAGDVA